MSKEFDRWNDSKKKLDQNQHLVDFHEREIWWCSIGINVGSEQDSNSVDFSRPVIVIKKFTKMVFWGIPLTTKIRKGEFRTTFKLNGIDNDILVLQMRTFDRKRLINKVGVLSKYEFESLLVVLVKLLTKSMKTPSEGVSEAEARVFTEIPKGYPYTRSIEEHRLLSRFYGNLYSEHYKIATRT